MSDRGEREDVLIEGKKHAPENLGRVLVLGLGKSGLAAAGYLLALLGGRVSHLAIAAGAENERSRKEAERLREAGADVAFGDDAVAGLAERAGGSFDLCIASPGIPAISGFYESAREASAELISEVEFAWRESDADSIWVAITGTNGKTTTTSLTEHILRQAGLPAFAVGNIGSTCIERVGARDAGIYVVEASSFQLESTRLFAPNVAVVLNITPDHVEWHGTLQAYADAKWKVLANLSHVPGAYAVLGAADDAVRAKIREIKQVPYDTRGFSYVPVGTADGVEGDMRARCGSENAAFVNADGVLTVALAGTEHELSRRDELLIKGAHNVENALCAATCAVVLGVSDDDVAYGLLTFEPLEHRIEPCGAVRGVECYNDSKATNVDATLKAFSAFPDKRPIVLLGGHDKGTDLAPLVEAARAHAKAVVVFGEARERFLSAFGGAAPASAELPAVIPADHMQDALDAALSVAEQGDIVVLSPACSSFDEFTCYEERGDVFKKLVADRAARG